MKTNTNKCTNTPFFSIVIPTHNASKFVERAVGSITTQKFRDFEIVIVDDKSTDSTRNILEKLKDNNENIRIYFQDENRGTLATRAKGVDCSKGLYIMFLDQDDTFTQDALLTLHQKVIQTKCDILHFGVHVIPENDNAKKAAKDCEKWLCPALRKLYGTDILKFQFLETNNFDWLVHHKVFTAKLAKCAWSNFYEIKLTTSDDFLMSFILCANAKTYVSLPNCNFYEYHLGAGETYSHDYNIDSWKKICEVDAKCLALIKEYVSKNEHKIKRNDWDEQTCNCQNKLIEHVMNEMYDNLSPNEIEECTSYALKNWDADAVLGELWRFVRDLAFEKLVKGKLDAENEEKLQQLLLQVKKFDETVKYTNNERYLNMKETALSHLSELDQNNKKTSWFDRIRQRIKKGQQ